MIIEVHLSPEEDLANADHLEECDDRSCDDVAHLCETAAHRFSDTAEVLVFVDQPRASHLRRLERARLRDREAERARQKEQQLAGLAAIRLAWDQLESADDA